MAITGILGLALGITGTLSALLLVRAVRDIWPARKGLLAIQRKSGRHRAT